MSDKRPCPACGREVEVPRFSADRDSPGASNNEAKRDEARSSSVELFPFCSQRCRMVDLGRWLDGGYIIPGESLNESGED